MIPRLKIPIEFNGTSFATVEQGSDEDIRQCVYASLATPYGSRPELVDFGLESQLFRAGGVDEDEIRATIERDEPRATEIFTESEIVGMAETVRVSVSG